ncbi:hypothetical protein JYU34_001702 [Plutella xylostella]|uniref:SWIM-type domain-containing protein n=3 Tax=Plutella xylostella TaxID=51655 RepID=A0ABQ7R4K8_PLUXY|nr:hypothetical protein JYU34_001702 [Plutella xylostella]
MDNMYYFFMFQDSGSMFNFIAPDHILAKQGGENSNLRRRKLESIIYSHIKMPMEGHKVIKLEIYDAERLKGEGICKCNADICCQHIVKNLFKDEIYKSAQDLISKITDNLAAENRTGYF